MINLFYIATYLLILLTLPVLGLAIALFFLYVYLLFRD